MFSLRNLRSRKFDFRKDNFGTRKTNRVVESAEIDEEYDESNKKVDAFIAEHRKAVEVKAKQYKKL